MISDNELRRFRATIEVSHEDGEAMLALPGIAGRLLEEIEELRAQLHEFTGAGDVDLGRDKPASQRAHRLWNRILFRPLDALRILQCLLDEAEAAKKPTTTGAKSQSFVDLLRVLGEVSEMGYVDEDHVQATELTYGHVRNLRHMLRLLVDEEGYGRKMTTREYAVWVFTHWSNHDENVVALAGGYLALLAASGKPTQPCEKKEE